MTTTISRRSSDESEWSPGSWQKKTARQQPTYPDPEAVRSVQRTLERLPPLVTSNEVDTLKARLRAATCGEMFLLQGGDCSESFDECEASNITAKLRVLLQMSQLIADGSQTHVIRAGRIAGQYAKPRSSPEEIRGEVALPSYRGAMINRLGFTELDRMANPSLMLAAHYHAAMTLNFIRALVGRHTEWHYQEHAEFFTSHEALLLPYEQSQTRIAPCGSHWYNLSAHFPWLGNRTRDVDGAHVEYLRGIANPIAIKVGPPVEPEEVLQLVEILNPMNEPGRLTLVHRFGADDIERHLPPIINILKRHEKVVLWCCDPMHGNTEITASGVKTRSFEKIVLELERAFWIHAGTGSRLGGLHVELTGEYVTECVGGTGGIRGHDLAQAYRSHVDPRLNSDQALELATHLARVMSHQPRSINDPTPASAT